MGERGKEGLLFKSAGWGAKKFHFGPPGGWGCRARRRAASKFRGYPDLPQSTRVMHVEPQSIRWRHLLS